MRRIPIVKADWKASQGFGFALMALLFFIWTGAESPVQAEDLLAIYQQALDTSPVLKGSKASLESDRAFHQMARSALMPRVNASAAANRDHADIKGFGKDFGASAAFGDITDTFWGGSYSVTLTQPIINGQAWSGLQAADEQVRSGQAAVTAAEQDLVLQVTEAYFGVLNAQAAERVALGQQKLLGEILDQAKANLKVGSGDIISLQEAQARYDAAESESIRAHNAVEIAIQQLQRLTHQPVETLDDLGHIVPQGPEPDQMAPWSLSAEKNQPLLEQARAQLNAARDQVEIARRSRWPNLNMTAGYGYNKGNFMPSVETKTSQVGLMLNLPIYEGGEITAQIDRAKAQEAVSQYRMDDLKDQIDLNTQSAFLNLRNSVSRLNAESQAVDSAKTSLDATRKGYEIGARSIIDLLTSAQDYRNVQWNYYQALYDHILSRVRLKWAAGVIGQRDVAAINDLLSKRAP